MNIISEILNSKPNNQALLSHYLNDVKEYFKRMGALNEQKTYNRILKIAESTQKYVPLLYSITNISMKLISVIRARVDDKFEDQKKEIEQSGSVTEMENIQKGNSADDEPLENIYGLLNIKRGASRKQINQDFLRKLVLDVVDELMDEINQCQDFVLKELSSALDHSSNILVFDSYLTNKPIISKIATSKNIKVTYVRTSGADQRNNQINLVDVPSKIRKFKKVIISGISILKNGSVVAEPGSLMVSLAAKKYKVPLVVVSRGFGLTEKVLIDQYMLLADNPMKYYEKKQENMLKTHIAKKFDLIENTEIREIITQLGTISAVNIEMQFCSYYDYI